MRLANLSPLLFACALIACASEDRNDDATDRQEQALGLADVVTSTTVCQMRVRSLGDPAMNKGISMPVAEVCRPDDMIEGLPFVAKELAVLWGTKPAKVCTWRSGDETRPDVCGGMSPRDNAYYCLQDDSVVLDEALIDRTRARHGPFAAAAILAHEWGHLNQARTGLFGQLEPPYRYSIQNELNADCQAGMFIALEAILGRPITGEDAAATYRQFCELGDNLPWHVEGAHGSCAQRTAFFSRGYQNMLEYGYLLCQPTGHDAQNRPTGLAAMIAICQ